MTPILLLTFNLLYPLVTCSTKKGWCLTCFLDAVLCTLQIPNLNRLCTLSVSTLFFSCSSYDWNATKPGKCRKIGPTLTYAFSITASRTALPLPLPVRACSARTFYFPQSVCLIYFVSKDCRCEEGHPKVYPTKPRHTIFGQSWHHQHQRTLTPGVRRNLPSMLILRAAL